jgi:hypothetical protein
VWVATEPRRSLGVMDPIRLDDLSDDLRASLEARARAQGLTPSAYVLALVLADLGATTSWSAWLAELGGDEPVASVDAAAALGEERSARAARLATAVLGDRS